MPTAISTMRTLFSSVTEMVEARAQEFPDYEIVGVPDKSFHFSRYTYRHLDETSTRLAHYYTDAGFKPRTCGDTTTQLVVALLAPSGFDYIVNELALVKMGELSGQGPLEHVADRHIHKHRLLCPLPFHQQLGARTGSLAQGNFRSQNRRGSFSLGCRKRSNCPCQGAGR
jgi:hypothetical protein